MKRILLLTLALLIALSGTALASKSQLAGNLGDFSASSWGNLEPYAEPITMTIGIPVDLSKAFPEGDSYENNVWSRAYEEELGIKLELAFTAANTDDKINSLIATGDKKLAATFETEVRIDDRIEIDGKKWRVVQPNPVKPADVLISYNIQLRA